ncbi:MAG: large conductance mechanosensitive channel protein MscL [Lentimicrobiaceae bacterium]|jgi:large conductance mechanosensitive channel
MAIIKEFKDFIMKGNVVDLAIAVIIGGAFGAIVNSLIADVITPLLLNPALEAAGVKDIAALTWGAVKYGNFLSAVISFLVIAFVLFMLIKGFNATKKKEVAAPSTPPAVPANEVLLAEIRDLLKAQK